jgi:hypothetical protein
LSQAIVPQSCADSEATTFNGRIVSARINMSPPILPQKPIPPSVVTLSGTGLVLSRAVQNGMRRKKAK